MIASTNRPRRSRSALLLGAAFLSLAAGSSAQAQLFDQQITTSGAISLPADLAAFTSFRYDLCGCDLNVTLQDPGSLVAGDLQITGLGRFENLASFSTTGRSVLLFDDSSALDRSSKISFTNRGNLTAEFTTGGVGVAGGIADTPVLEDFVNTGLIDIRGDDVTGALLDLGGNFGNTGTLRATGANGRALTLFTFSGQNAGVIEAVGAGSEGALLQVSEFGNSGRIEGGARGAALTGRLVNSGTVRATEAGGVAIEALADSQGMTVVNETGATIQGTTAIRGSSDPDTSASNRVGNRGAIIGNVELGAGADLFSVEGGTLQGNLQLGDGNDIFVTDLANAANLGAGITGTLDAGDGDDTLRLRTGTTASANIALASGFEQIAYEAVGKDTVLTLNAAAPVTTSVGLTGDGRINVTADFTAELASALVVDGETTAQALSGSTGPDLIDLPGTLNVVSTGQITLADVAPFNVSAVAVGEFARFENAGTITVNDTDANSAVLTGIQAGFSSEIVNSKAIALGNGAEGINGGRVLNTGSIAQIDGTSDAVGITGAFEVDNRGSIKVGGVAISAGFGTGSIVNTGAIESTGSAAIVSNSSDLIVENRAGGTIVAGGGAALNLTPSTAVINAGAITGNVSFGAQEDLFLAAGGTVTGNVDLGGGNDNVLVSGSGTGVSGTLTGGAGIDAFGRVVTASGSYALEKPADFENFAVALDGKDLSVTLDAATGVTGGVRVFGAGKVENRANITVTSTNGVNPAIDLIGSTLGFEAAGTLAFTNSATIDSNGGGVQDSSGAVSSFTNTGTIRADQGAVILDAGSAGGEFNFSNSGTIEGRNGGNAVFLDVESIGTDGRARFANSGTIIGQTGFDVEDALLIANNTGSITGAESTQGTFITYSLTSGLSVDVTNSGTFGATGIGSTALALFSDTPGDGGNITLDCDPITGQPINPYTAARLLNSGMISATGGNEATLGNIAAAAVFTQSADFIRAEATNAAGGTIESTGNGTAVVATGGQFQLVNAGTIRGSAGSAQTTGATFRTNGGGSFEIADGFLAGAIHSTDAVDTITNTGTIIGSVDLGAGNDTVTNSGTINGDVFLRGGNDVFRGGGTIGNVDLGGGDDLFAILPGLILNGTVSGGDGNDTLTVELGGGAVNFDTTKFLNFEVTAARLGQGQSASVNGDARSFDTLLVDGGTLTVTTGTPLVTASATTITGGNAADNVVIQAGGGVAGSIALADGDDTVSNGGTIGGDVLLGAGNDRFAALAGSSVTGTVFGGAGTDTFSYLLAGNATGLPAVQEFETVEVNGTGTLSLSLAQSFDALQLNGTGLNVTAANGFTIGRIGGSDGAETVTLASGILTPVALGGGADVLNLTLNGLLPTNVDGGAGADTLNLALAGASSIDTVTNFEAINVTGTSPLTLTGTLAAGQALGFDGGNNSFVLASGSTLSGTVNGGAGVDILTAQTVANGTRSIAAASVTGFETLVADGAGTLALTDGSHSYQNVAVNGGNLSLGAGAALTAGTVVFDGAANRFSLASGATATGAINGGAGVDTVALTQGANTTRNLSSLNLTGFEQLASAGAGTLVIDSNPGLQSVTLDGGTTTLAAGITLAAPISGGTGAETVSLLGTLNGALDLGAGDDRLIMAAVTNGSGARSGGTGTDTLEFRTAGTAAAPAVFNGQGYAGFENLTNGAGVLALTGTQSYGTVAVTGGRLIGQAGSVLTSTNTIQVAQGATFGSAGTVNANIAVAGTLSPGASPGTMTVNGNVSFAAGSNLLLELTPTARDLLNISGTLSIAQGAAIDITGSLPAQPGAAIDLVVANGGISGSFSTVNKSPTVFGFVAQNGNRLQLRGEFQNNTGFSANTRAGIAYANALLGSGQLVQPFTAALPNLVNGAGVSNARAFGQLTPEAYASASQIGVQNALAITDAGRTMAMATPIEPGAYVFGQALAGFGNIDARQRTTLGRGDVDTVGGLTGIGYGFEGGTRVGAFLGWLSSEQSLRGLGASSEGDGFVGGAFADASLAGFGLHALVAYSQTDLRTNRALIANGSSVRGNYDLNTLVADFTVDRSFALGSELALTPKLGLTYTQVKRDRVTEGGGNGFGLIVAGRTQDALFGDASIGLQTVTSVGDMAVTPWVKFGLRHRLSGDPAIALGQFGGATGTARILAQGVDLDRTVARIGTGVGLDVAKNVRMNVGYDYEVGDSQRHAVSGGVSIRF